jgi:hypothetical protein
VIETTSTASINLTMDLGSLLPKGPSMNPAPIVGGPPAGAIPSGKLTFKGTVDSDTTSWIDPSAHRIVKTQMHGKYDTTASFDMPPDASSPIPFTGLGVKGTQQLSLDPV